MKKSLFLLTVVVVAGGTFVVMRLLENIRERKYEARESVLRIADIDESVIDPAVWGKNFPRQYDGYKRTVDIERIRLEELQIVTYMDLAYMNPIRLIARTGYSLRHVLSWVDQALLVVYVPALKLELTNVGLPCALDVREFYLDHFYDEVQGKERDWKQDETVLELVKATQRPAVFLKESFQRVYSDPHVGFLAEVWYDQSKLTDTP